MFFNYCFKSHQLCLHAVCPASVFLPIPPLLCSLGCMCRDDFFKKKWRIHGSCMNSYTKLARSMKNPESLVCNMKNLTEISVKHVRLPYASSFA